ncbi:MAG TPA: 16S rRNA (cytosine(1402)-N(4))-methyltransferase RsmH [Thermodesulfobacteriaceae bacterium]|nr:16S rRNA (cytosine(1402)-N(4))-methyltransferase RsmH [Thermodesulfobacteriaceae bacterium]
MTSIHASVMVDEIMEGLYIRPGGVYVDATTGMGGHIQAILQRHPEVEMIIGFDMDAETIDKARERLASFGSRVHLIHSNFCSLPDILYAEEMDSVDGILMDLGLSSYQLERSGRGFSFLRDEPLDMRMNRFGTVTAADMVNRMPENRLAELFRSYGEERWARRIAKKIVERRSRNPVLTSADLARIVAEAIPRRFHPRRIHPATRVFQALRIAVNTELENLKSALDYFPTCLKKGGRLCIISFHSLEDRLVKHAFRNDVRLNPLTRKPMTPGQQEIMQNPRARSAKLRIAERVK